MDLQTAAEVVSIYAQRDRIYRLGTGEVILPNYPSRLRLVFAQAAITAILLYEILRTFDTEYILVWRSRWSFAKAIWFFNRVSISPRSAHSEIYLRSTVLPPDRIHVSSALACRDLHLIAPSDLQNIRDLYVLKSHH